MGVLQSQFVILVCLVILRAFGHVTNDPYSPPLAVKMAYLCAVSYSDHPAECVKKIIKQQDYEIVRTIRQRCTDSLVFDDECQAIVALSHKEKQIIVAYQGTKDTTQLIHEFYITLDAQLQPFVIGGKVGKYFKMAHDKLLPCIKSSLIEIKKNFTNYKVMVTGHSLGAALAVLGSSQLMHEDVLKAEETIVYTYGSPRVGNKDFAMAFNKLVPTNYRLVHGNDCVPELPPTILNVYHVETEIYYNVSMNNIQKYKLCKGGEDPTCGTFNIISALTECIQDHRHYFNLEISCACDNKLRGFKLWSKKQKLPDEDKCYVFEYQHDHSTKLYFSPEV